MIGSDPAGGTTVYLGDTELHVAPGATTATGSRTYTADGLPIAERDTTAGVSGSTLYWLGDDVDGTPDLEVNAATGAVTYRYTDPFGNPRGSSAPAWSSDRAFLNDPVSALSGLTQVGARLYDPVTGSFTTADPLLDPSSMASVNGYAYAGNNPVTDTDPSGECLNANGSLDHFTNCAGGQGVNKDGAEVHAEKQPGYAQQHEDDVIAEDAWVGGPGYWSSPAFGKLGADALNSALANLPKAPPGESLEDKADLLSADALMQMFQMNSASELAPEDGEEVAAAGSLGRLPQDIAANPAAPRALPLNRPVSSSAGQNEYVQNRIGALQAAGASDFRVNQQQVDINGVRVGINRPDLQYTFNAQRFYEEFDVPTSTRGPDHQIRILSNDPSGIVNLFTVP